MILKRFIRLIREDRDSRDSTARRFGGSSLVLIPLMITNRMLLAYVEDPVQFNSIHILYANYSNIHSIPIHLRP